MPEEIEGLYTRQIQLKLNTPGSIVVVGCGGIGSWVAIFAGMSGIKNIFLYDPDLMEESNRNRLPFCQSSIGRPKVEVVSEFIRGIRSDVVAIPIRDKVTAGIMKAQFSCTQPVVVDCTDSPKTQVMLYNLCLKRNVPFIRAGYDGTHITVTSIVSGWIDKASDEEQYEVQPSWVVPSVVCAALAVGKMMRFFNQEVSTDIGEIGIDVLKKQKRASARCYDKTKSDKTPAVEGSSGQEPAEVRAPEN